MKLPFSNELDTRDDVEDMGRLSEASYDGFRTPGTRAEGGGNRGQKL